MKCHIELCEQDVLHANSYFMWMEGSISVLGCRFCSHYAIIFELCQHIICTMGNPEKYTKKNYVRKGIQFKCYN